MPAVHLIIKGKVQGVFYRQSAKKEAVKLGINGWVKNNEDGTVEAVATGSEEQIQRFIKWCRQGPTLAHVSEVVVTKIPEEAFNGFQVRH
jgi:acylphosphatase